MDLNSISKTTFAVICWAVTLALVFQLLFTFWVEKPTTSTKIEKNLEDTDIPEVVICLDPGFNNVMLAKYGYHIDLLRYVIIFFKNIVFNLITFRLHNILGIWKYVSIFHGTHQILFCLKISQKATSRTRMPSSI